MSKPINSNSVFRFLLTLFRIFKKNILGIIFLLLVCSYFVITSYHAQNDYITSDEIAHIAAAESYLSGEGLNLEHPPAQKFLNSIFIRIFMPDLNFEGSQENREDQFTRGAELYFDGQYSPEFYLTVSRVSYIFFNGLFLVWIFVYAWIFKLIPKLFSLILGSLIIFSTSFFSHAHLATFDVGGSLTLLMAISSFLLLVRNFAKFNQRDRYLHLFIFIFCLILALTSKFSNIIILPILVLAFGSVLIFLLVRKQKATIWKSLRFAGLSMLTIFLVIGGFYQCGFYAKEYNFSRNSGLEERSLAYKIYAGFNSKTKEISPDIHSKLIPWWWYADGAASTLARSQDDQNPFLFGSYKNINFGEYALSIIWFKENPVLFLLAVLGLILGFYKMLIWAQKIEFQNSREYFKLKNADINWSSIFTPKVYFGLFLGLFPLIYFASSFDKGLVIGYRHFYPVLVFIYLLIAYSSHLLFRIKELRNFIVVVLLGYISLGALALPESLGYVNFFWSQEKYQLTGDSTINWGQESGQAYQFLLNEEIIKEENAGKIASYIFPLSMAPDKIVRTLGGPNYPKLGDEGGLYLFPVDKILIEYTDWEYLVSDTTFFQETLRLKKNSSVAQRNYEFIKSLRPIFSSKQIVFVYKLKT